MSLISETASPVLLKSLQAKLQHRSPATQAMGALEPVALRLGLLQHSPRPHLHDPQLLLCVADHGLAVDGIHVPAGGQTEEMVQQVLSGQAPIASVAPQMGLSLTLIDCGVASRLPPHDRMLLRKIAHGTRNARISHAMNLEQAHAAIRAGMEIGDSLPGNVVACAGMGVGSNESAALVLARLCDLPLRDLLTSGPTMSPEIQAHLLALLQAAHQRHREVQDPVEVLAALGGFETAVMVGIMLVAASKRHLVMIDGMAACAALMVASRIAPAATDYAVFCRSTLHEGLDHALGAFQAGALLELGLETTPGTGACLSWPLVRAAAALLDDRHAPPDAHGGESAAGALSRSGVPSIPGVDVLESDADDHPLFRSAPR